MSLAHAGGRQRCAVLLVFLSLPGARLEGSAPPPATASPPPSAATSGAPAVVTVAPTTKPPSHHNASKVKPPAPPIPPRPTRTKNTTSAAAKVKAPAAAAKSTSKAEQKAELLAFVGNLTGRHHDGNRSSERDERDRGGGHSRGLGKLLALCGAALLLPIAIAVALIVRARRKQQQGELVPQDDAPPDGYGMQDE